MVARTLRALVPVLCLVALPACGGGGGGDGDPGPIAERVAGQLRYHDPSASSLVAVDLRFEGDNWKDLRPLIARVLRAYRGQAEGEDRATIPPNAEGALSLLASFAGLRFAEDVRPALDGHLLVGVLEPPRRARPPDGARGDIEASVVVTYQTSGGDLRPIAERVADGDPLAPFDGFEDTLKIDEGIALVGDDLLVAAFGEGPGDPLLRSALGRARDGDGFPAARLEQAERDAGLPDPLVLATGDLRIARQLVASDDLDRAAREVPYLRALRRAGAAVDVDRQAITARARLTTDRVRLRDADLPVGPAGEIELPEPGGDRPAIAGASRDQSRTTTFASRIARALFADSRFARAVSRAEDDLGVAFEEEVLRQFDCPSVSILEPRDTRAAAGPAAQAGAQRFGARSCVRDPERMRALLPRLWRHLPAILTGLQGLGDEGLLGLLLIAPDAPLTPGGLLADIGVRPLGGGSSAGDETLYEISGLRDGATTSVGAAGPDRLVFGLIGDVFVVASDREMARRVRDAPTEALDERAASAVRTPLGRLLAADRSDDVGVALGAVLGELTASVAATPAATQARARIALAE